MTTEEILWNATYETATVETASNGNIETMETELQALYEMTEEEACDYYQVNNKAEAEILIREFWR